MVAAEGCGGLAAVLFTFPTAGEELIPPEQSEWSGRGDVAAGRGPRCGIRKKTAEAINDPILLMQQPFVTFEPLC